MRYPVFPVGAFIAAVLVLIPLPAHWRSRNVATVSIIVWLFMLDVIYGVNTIVWDRNVQKHLFVWCDISKFTLLCCCSGILNCRSYQACDWRVSCTPSCHDVCLPESRARRVRTYSTPYS